jgi:short-subunit dehydrogenase
MDFYRFQIFSRKKILQSFGEAITVGGTMKKTILVLGAASGIARAFCLQALQRGYALILAGRNKDALERMVVDLSIRAQVSAMPCVFFDACKTETHEAFLNEVLILDPTLEGVFIACGTMPSQEECESHFESCDTMIRTNFTGLVSMLNLLVKHFEKQKSGFISCVSSIAGDRGRRNNYIYGATKAALNVYLEGLYVRLHASGVLVQTVKPGPVDTPMTREMPLSKLPFLATPERVAKDIWNAIEKRKNVVYTPWIWFPIMTLLCHIPSFLWKRMKR